MESTRYELPAGGISTLGYVVRRMHKTAWLEGVPRHVQDGDAALALARVGVYALVALTSFGPVRHRARSNRPGDVEGGIDPVTGAVVSARAIARNPRTVIRSSVAMPDGATATGSEEARGWTVSFKGIGTPAAVRFSYRSRDYEATLEGVMTREMTISIFGCLRVRGFGALSASDSTGSRGAVSIDRTGRIRMEIGGIPYGANLATMTIARPAVPVPEAGAEVRARPT